MNVFKNILIGTFVFPLVVGCSKDDQHLVEGQSEDITTRQVVYSDSYLPYDVNYNGNIVGDSLNIEFQIHESDELIFELDDIKFNVQGVDYVEYIGFKIAAISNNNASNYSIDDLNNSISVTESLMNNIADTVSQNTLFDLETQGLSISLSILKGMKRNLMSGSTVSCTPIESFGLEMSSFACEEDIVLYVDDFYQYVENHDDFESKGGYVFLDVLDNYTGMILLLKS